MTLLPPGAKVHLALGCTDNRRVSNGDQVSSVAALANAPLLFLSSMGMAARWQWRIVWRLRPIPSAAAIF